MVHMMNCPNCKMPQKEGDRCACGCPVTVEMREELERRERQDKIPPVLRKPAPLDEWKFEI